MEHPLQQGIRNFSKVVFSGTPCIWCFRPFKPFIFSVRIWSWQRVSVNISSVAELSPVYCCLVKCNFLMFLFLHLNFRLKTSVSVCSCCGSFPNPLLNFTVCLVQTRRWSRKDDLTPRIFLSLNLSRALHFPHSPSSGTHHSLIF